MSKTEYSRIIPQERPRLAHTQLRGLLVAIGSALALWEFGGWYDAVASGRTVCFRSDSRWSGRWSGLVARGVLRDQRRPGKESWPSGKCAERTQFCFAITGRGTKALCLFSTNLGIRTNPISNVQCSPCLTKLLVQRRGDRLGLAIEPGLVRKFVGCDRFEEHADLAVLLVAAVE